MAIRPLTPLETDTTEKILASAGIRPCEFAAFLDTPSGPLIELSTAGRPDGADPSEKVLQLIDAGHRVVVHHNHLSQESLSDTDWYGLAKKFAETFAHCADGTCYWGRVLQPSVVETAIANGAVELQANNLLYDLIIWDDSESPAVAQFFRKEVMNRAMRQCGFVEYEYAWGSLPNPPVGPSALTRTAGELGKRFDAKIDQAASALASHF